VPQKEALTERLKYLTEVFRVAWVFLLAVGSGTVGLWLGPRDFWRSVFAVAGVVVIVILVLAIGTVHRRIQRLLTRLEDL
jgi:membrane protein YdbS with pleckstrin-like domain